MSDDKHSFDALTAHVERELAVVAEVCRRTGAMSEQHPGKVELVSMQKYLDTRMCPMGKGWTVFPSQFSAIASYVSDLESRLEKAEAERDRFERSREAWHNAWRALSSPTPDQGDEA